jgi:transglycosylase-like protein with SLT domain
MNIEPTANQPTATGAIRQAARLTGADFKYLLATAQVESSLNPSAQAPTSSARGLFQFIEQTWLSTLKEQGGPLGYAPYANAISKQPSGQYTVTDPRMYDRIMDLRTDPNANALMAGAYTRANAGKLADRLGRAPTEGELYIAHFMGPGGAARLIDLAELRPYTPAASLFPGPARANPAVFYDAQGNARGAADVYRTLVGRYGAARTAPPNPVASAAANTAAKTAANAPANTTMNVGELRRIGPARVPSRPMVMPDASTVASTYAQAEKTPAARIEDNGPMFHGLFRSGGDSEPVAPVVNALWGTPPATTTAPATTATPPATAYAPAPAEPRRPQPLDLFQDQLPDAKSLFRGRV